VKSRKNIFKHFGKEYLKGYKKLRVNSGCGLEYFPFALLKLLLSGY